jgi:hypothetical protein
VVSIDGNPSPNYYNDYWVQWSIKSPLLAHLAILTSAIYQAEAQKIVPQQSQVVLRYKVKSIELLNEMLSHRHSATSPEAIAAVIYLMVNEWYFCNHDIVQRHMAGLKEMVRMRGGLDDLGMNGFVRKMIFQYVRNFQYLIRRHADSCAALTTTLPAHTTLSQLSRITYKPDLSIQLK